MEPDLWKRGRTWAVIAGIFTVLGLLNALQFHLPGVNGQPVPLRDALVGTLPFWYAKALLLPGVLWAARRFPLRPGAWGRRLAPHLPLSLLYSAGHITLGVVAGALLEGIPLGDEMVRGRITGLFTAYGVVGVVYYWAFLGTILAFDFHRALRAREREAAALEIRASRLEASLARASLDALRMQLNPHFLYNTLNSISVLAQTGHSDRVVRMLSRLSGILRTTLEGTDPEVTLAEELAFLDGYLEIERERFADRLTVERDIDPRALAALVPSLVLQPLVENALKHGVGGARGPVEVRIEAGLSEGRLVMRVSDSGPGFRPGVEDRLGVGLSNTRARLEQLYGDDFGLELSPPGRGATVTVTLPYEPAVQLAGATA